MAVHHPAVLILYHAGRMVNRVHKEIDHMHPLLTEHIAKLHMRELQQQAAVERLAATASRHAGGHLSWQLLYYLLLGSYVPGYHQDQASMKQEAISRQSMHSIIRQVGLAALGIGFLAGGFLGTRFGLLPAAILSGTILLIISASIVLRSIIILKERRLPLARGR